MSPYEFWRTTRAAYLLCEEGVQRDPALLAARERIREAQEGEKKALAAAQERSGTQAKWNRHSLAQEVLNISDGAKRTDRTNPCAFCPFTDEELNTELARLGVTEAPATSSKPPKR